MLFLKESSGWNYVNTSIMLYRKCERSGHQIDYHYHFLFKKIYIHYVLVKKK